MTHDFVVIGGGIVGLATAMRLVEQFPGKSVLLQEKEKRICAHQSGRNSGVIHSGIYYKPGSLKALLCRRGNASIVDFCRKNDVRYKTCGKLIVATSANELPQLEKLFQRGIEKLFHRHEKSVHIDVENGARSGHSSLKIHHLNPLKR